MAQTTNRSIIIRRFRLYRDLLSQHIFYLRHGKLSLTCCCTRGDKDLSTKTILLMIEKYQQGHGRLALELSTQYFLVHAAKYRTLDPRMMVAFLLFYLFIKSKKMSGLYVFIKYRKCIK